ncbi:MAG: choice-of-anchor D domain-containing protein, partial [Fidelibacterota bacterium]
MKRLLTNGGTVAAVMLFLSSCSDLGEEPEPVRSITVHPSSIDFGTVTLGSSRTDSVTIVGDGTERVTVSVKLNSDVDSGFSILFPGIVVPAGNNFFVRPGDSLTVIISYSPTSTSGDLDSLVITNEDSPGQTFWVRVMGKGSEALVPNLEVSPATVNFGTVVIGDSSDTTLTLSNMGDTTLFISDIALSGTDAADFSLPEDFDIGELAPDGDTTFALRFRPGSEGGKSATLTIISNDPDGGSTTVSLVGAGAAL